MTVKSDDNEVAEDVEKVKNAFYQTTQNLKGQASEMISNSSEVICNNIADYTAQKPFKALGVALVTGLVLGYLWGRK